MNLKKRKLIQSLLAFAFVCTASLAQAQPPDDPGQDPDPVPVPFDGGISLVVAAGIAYAAKKGFDKRKKLDGNKPSEK